MPQTNFASLEGSGNDTASSRLYAEHGAVVVRQLLDASEVAAIRAEFTTHVEAHTDEKWLVGDTELDTHIPSSDILKRYPRYVMPHRRPELACGVLARKYLTDPRLFSVVENLLDGRALAAQSMFYFKPPSARGQAMHQDNFFLRTDDPRSCLAAWIAMDDAGADNGALKLVPGSHRDELGCPDATGADTELYFSDRGLRVPEGFQEVQSELRAGDVLFFHGGLIHGSLPNTSDRFRRALIFHYVPQNSEVVADFYQPLITQDGTEVTIGRAKGGGACGTAWESMEA